VAIVGAGAAGALVAIQLCELATQRRTPLSLVLIDPDPEAGRGVAYATRNPRHRLNVPAENMSCYPSDPEHFVRWLRRYGNPTATAVDFAERYRYGTYLAHTLGQAIVSAHGTVSVRHLRTRVTNCRWTDTPVGETAELKLDDGTSVDAHCVVLATGPARSASAWVPAALRDNDHFIAEPWAPGALDDALASERSDGHTGDVLLVGTGMTAVDVALQLDRRGRTIHAVSRHGRLPQAHATVPLPPEACPEALREQPLATMRTSVLSHISRVLRTHGDWRAAMDGLRPLTADLWSSLSPAERTEFIERDSALWNTHRHRMPPATAEAVARIRRTRRLRTYEGQVTAARTHPDGSLLVSLADARELSVSWVVDCTGPGRWPSDGADPLWCNLLASGTALLDPLALGVCTDDGRLRDANGHASRPLWTLGSPRRGELWESTSIPEIRIQAVAIAEAVLPAP
jgi:uncharacterized NAD(P)/FAD-binding protein YdhS